jgi:hypothetical protein
MYVRLPDREWITLFEAVSAFVNDGSRDTSKLYPSRVTDSVLEQLHNAAVAGEVRFRALNAGNKYQVIDADYFSTRYSFHWQRNEIQVLVPVPYAEYDGEYDEDWGVEWWDVHLDRDQFALLLQDMGVAVEPTGDSGMKENKSILWTGLAGRPTAVPLALAKAKRRLADGDYPDTKKEFSEQIVDAVKNDEPQAPPMTAKALSNNPKFSELWRCRPERPK